MAATEATDTGAEFEENDAPVKVQVNKRPRVEKPTITGAKPAGDLANEKVEEPKPLAQSKSTTLTPDISAEEAKPEEPAEPAEEETSPQNDEGQMVNEMAQAAADKKLAKDAAANPVEDNKIQSLVAEKTYFVPIGQMTKRRNTKIFVFVLLLVVAAAIAAYFVLLG